MKSFIKYIGNRTLKPVVSLYLSKERVYRHNGIKLRIHPEVFHPRFFFSTKFLLKFLLTLDLGGKAFLELGAGSGLISFSVARKNAIVTASDINTTAIAYLKKNGTENKIPVNVIESNLFQNIPVQAFDIIAINPPYYKRNPETQSQYAWYCGENSEYFTALFKDLGTYTHHGSIVLMVLSDDCDIAMITAIAANNSYNLILAAQKKFPGETELIYKIERVN